MPLGRLVGLMPGRRDRTGLAPGRPLTHCHYGPFGREASDRRLLPRLALGRVLPNVRTCLTRVRCSTRRSEPGVSEDPFRVLGVPPRPGLTDDDVRAAWRRIAAASHPDRDDGGDPARFGAAAAAYALLRTAYGRGEALADLGSRATRDRRSSGAAPGISHGRPGLLAVRVLSALAVSGFAFGVAGWAPATAGVVAGVLTWLVATARYDLPRRAPD